MLEHIFRKVRYIAGQGMVGPWKEEQIQQGWLGVCTSCFGKIAWCCKVVTALWLWLRDSGPFPGDRWKDSSSLSLAVMGSSMSLLQQLRLGVSAGCIGSGKTSARSGASIPDVLL
eukprot:1639120-Amphidinium_carterae.1